MSRPNSTRHKEVPEEHVKGNAVNRFVEKENYGN